MESVEGTNGVLPQRARKKLAVLLGDVRHVEEEREELRAGRVERDVNADRPASVFWG